MKEIGGYFGLEKFEGTEYYEDFLAVNTARNALLYLLQARLVKKLYIPYFLCDSISGLLIKYGYEFDYYKIDTNFMPIFDKEMNENEYLYVVNYYGQISNQKIKKIVEKTKNIILDNVQAFFQSPISGIDTIYSCRKYFGVPDGAYIYTNAKSDLLLSTDESKDRMNHLLGRFESGNASSYYSDFQLNENKLEESELKQMSPIAHNILKAINYESVKEKRNENYAVLEKKFSAINHLALETPIGPFMYPLYCSDGLNIKKLLAKEGIYIPTLWPNVLKMNEKLEADYAANILPLPCDQRYTSDDMLTLIDVVMKYV